MELIKAKPEDEEFLFEVYAGSRMDEINEWQWNEKQKKQFLQIQYRSQQLSYKHKYPHLETKIIVAEKEKVGRLVLADLRNKLVIVDLTILPQFQGKGMGTKVLLECQESARKHDKTVQLSVFRSNERAKSLYEQMGFKQVECNDLYIFMEWIG